MTLGLGGLLEERDEVVVYARVADGVAFDLVTCLGQGYGVETYRAVHAIGHVRRHHDFDLICGRRNR